MAGPSQDRGNPDPSLGFLQNKSLQKLVYLALVAWRFGRPQESEVRRGQMNYRACIVNVSVACRPESAGRKDLQQSISTQKSTPEQ